MMPFLLRIKHLKKKNQPLSLSLCSSVWPSLDFYYQKMRIEEIKYADYEMNLNDLVSLFYASSSIHAGVDVVSLPNI